MGFWSFVMVLRYHHATAKPPAIAEATDTNPKASAFGLCLGWLPASS
jgi:hypothetical protein